MLVQDIEVILSAHFGICHVEETCSAATWLALGSSLGLSRPFLIAHPAGARIPLDNNQGMGMYQFQNFLALTQQLVARHKALFGGMLHMESCR